MTRASLAVACAVAVVGGRAASGAAVEPVSTALLPVVAADLLEPQRHAFEERIRTFASKRGIALMSEAETAKNVAQAQKLGAGCNLDVVACQAQIGVLIGVQRVLVARVASDWNGDRFELRLVDALRGESVRETNQVLPKDAALQERVLTSAIARVLVPERTGSLSVKPPPGSTVIVDGVAHVGDPEKIEGLYAGKHDVEIQAGGKTVEKHQVDVEAGTIATVVLTASKEVPPPGGADPLWPWLVGGGAAAAGVAGVGAGVLEAALELFTFDRNTRGVMRVTGIGLLGVTAIGVVAIGTGGVLLATEPGP